MRKVAAPGWWACEMGAAGDRGGQSCPSERVWCILGLPAGAADPLRPAAMLSSHLCISSLLTHTQQWRGDAL